MFIVMVFLRISFTVIFRPLWRSHTEALVGTLLGIPVKSRVNGNSFFHEKIYQYMAGEV